jgi:cell division protein FtsB
VRLATVALLLLLVLVQAELWFGSGGIPHVMGLESQLAAQRSANERARAANDRLAAEVIDLKEGREMVEEKARRELGMVKPDEILVQVAPAPASAPR